MGDFVFRDGSSKESTIVSVQLNANKMTSRFIVSKCGHLLLAVIF